MIVEGLVLVGAILAGRYLIPSKKARKMCDVTFQRLAGTYRDPALYEITVEYPRLACAPNGIKRYYKVRNVNEIPEPDRTTVVNGFKPRHIWLDNFLNGKDSKEE